MRIAITLTACALFSGCGTMTREVSTVATLQKGAIKCHDRQLIWESSDISHGCDVTVTYSGSEECSARLLYLMPKAGGATDVPPSASPPIIRTPGQKTEPAGAAGLTVKLRDVQAIYLACGEPGRETESPQCSYSIDRINCSRNAAEINTTTNTAAVFTNVVVTCGDAAKLVWEAPAGGAGAKSGCHVTVRLKGSSNCPAVLECVEASGRKRRISADDRGECVSLINVVKVTLSCSGSSGTDSCTCDVVQIDSPP